MTRPLIQSDDSPDISFEIIDAPRTSLSENFTIAYESPVRSNNGDSVSLLSNSTGSCNVLRLWAGDYLVSTDKIICRLHEPDRKHQVETDLLGKVIALWMGRRGRQCLHGSAIRVGDKAVAFLGSSHAGKSTIAATLVRKGCSLITDDLLATEHSDSQYLCYPGYPELRFWPHHARFFTDDLGQLNTIHPQHKKLRVSLGTDETGAFPLAAVPLSYIFILDRLNKAGPTKQPIIEPMTAQDSVLALLSNVFLLPMAENLGIQADRLRFFPDLRDKSPCHVCAIRRGPNTWTL